MTAPDDCSSTELATTLNGLREGLGLTMRELAELLGVPRSIAYAWLQGRSAPAPEGVRVQVLREALESVPANWMRFIPQVWSMPLASGGTLLQGLHNVGAGFPFMELRAALAELEPRLAALAAEAARPHSRATGHPVEGAWVAALG